MLVQAQVVPWWGMGRPAELSPSGFHPVTASPTGRRIGGHDYKTDAIQGPQADNHTHFREMTKAIFRVFGNGVREITSREETERPPEKSARQIPACSRLSQEPKARWRSGRQIEPLPSLAGSWTTRVQARRVPADPTAARKPKACWRSGSADRTAPEQISQAPGLREFQARGVRADPTADRKPKACQ